MRISLTIDLAAIFVSPVSRLIFACGQANVLISSEATERPALLTGLSCDINGICISVRVRRYEAIVVLFTSSCECRNIIYLTTGPRLGKRLVLLCGIPAYLDVRPSTSSRET